ncbi:hypothetical protein PYH37_005967 (plasmid) [Sinorhizobium numidicum]|uniref:Helix-turn-helix domain-containing protein n=1 Tax=Sinorhizobium numidicum TaxID=680248 RepID=A0ABY8D4Z6_9HYPH|nr:hypothetical protein [Sinorhizobium numidicum]WEX79597.1 hypothetical protein PYH37_005967 [Sinorhizobium numidicum]WEX85447.1 hypothetical protein PYH38_006417 [Sinorhizobium numidicum]
MKLVHIPKTRFCTISEIVEKTGFDRATVHRALKNDTSVKFEVREKISYAIFDLNNQAIAKYQAELRRLT